MGECKFGEKKLFLSFMLNHNYNLCKRICNVLNIILIYAVSAGFFAEFPKLSFFIIVKNVA